MEIFIMLKRAIPLRNENNCVCCNQSHCDKNGNVVPEDGKILRKWQICKEKNICPGCNQYSTGPFWLRHDGIECCQCR